MAYPSETNPYPGYPPQRPGVNPWFIRLPVLFITGGILLVLVLGAFLAAFQLRYQDKIIPGMTVYGVNISGLTREEAITALESRFTYDDEAVFTFRYGDQFWQMTAAELGVAFDIEQTVDEAYSFGHTGSAVTNLADQANVWLNGRYISPIITYDQGAAAQKLAAIAAEINRSSANAVLNIDAMTVTTVPGLTGRTLDISATLNQLDAIITQLGTGAEIALVVNETPPTIWDTDAVAARVRAALSAPVVLVADGPNGTPLGPWTASVEQIRALLALELVNNGDGTQSYDVGVDVTAFRAYLESLAPGLITLPENARFHFNDDTRQLEVISPGQSGRALDVDATLAKLEESIFNPVNRVVPMAFTYAPPRYHSNMTAAELGITELVGESTTYYTGSTANRSHNIAEGASRFDGVIIGPGEEFSFNNLLGDINPEDGFVQGKVIFGGRTITGVGGGVCQVSTTVFRAALEAGFPIVERHSHGYRVGFYEINGFPGLDAAIWQPTADFRFVNDTPHHLLIETSIFPGSDSIQFRLYSTNPGRQVILEGPVIRDVVPPAPTIYEANAELALGQQLNVDWSAEGADITFTRRILDVNGNEIRTDTIYTHYVPWAAVVQVAPGDSRLG